MSPDVASEYLSTGGNRQTSAADWDSLNGLVCFGAGQNLALWATESASTASPPRLRGITCIENAHKETVTAVRFVSSSTGKLPVIISGSADQTIRVWQILSQSADKLRCTDTKTEHTGSITCLCVSSSTRLVVSGAADGTVKLWRLSEPHPETIKFLQKIELRSRCFPLTLSLSTLGSLGGLVLAVGGTTANVEIYASDESEETYTFKWKTTLTGHEGWISSLDFCSSPEGTASNLVLASASQDKYIRLWKIRENSNKESAMEPSIQPTLSNKIHHINNASSQFTISFEALLLGHEDWIYSVRWNQQSSALQLLSASADNSLVIWEPEQSSGIWICKDRLGEMSAHKGSTTATGSTGGFWIGLWSHTGRSILCLGRTGGWRRWARRDELGEWVAEEAVGGHTKDVRDLAWSNHGEYLLSTSADQTTRIHAWSDRRGQRSWFELARPQIHGYDINCVESIDGWQFVSGADEKLLRVFDAPRAFALSLEALSGTSLTKKLQMPETASVPVLGLSNKVGLVQNGQSIDEEEFDGEGADVYADPPQSLMSFTKPPYEEILSRHTLWPEREKLYGHGFEVSALAVSHDGLIIATACKASSIEHAVIRLYDTRTWQAVNPPLKAHCLTVTGLDFTENGAFLISGGRDRQWTVFNRSESEPLRYKILASNPKGHSRMILDVCWLQSHPLAVFGTAGRDKCIHFWSQKEENFVQHSTIAAASAVSSIDACQLSDNEAILIAYGQETGNVIIHFLNPVTLGITKTYELGESISPSLYVNRVKWQPYESAEKSGDRLTVTKRLAIASQDTSVRIVKLQIT